MLGAKRGRLNIGNGSLSAGLQFSATAAHDFVCARRRAGKEGIDMLTHLGGSTKAAVGGHLLPRPVPDGLVRVEVRAVGRQSDQGQVKVRGGEVGTDGRSAMGWAVVSDDNQRPSVLGPQLLQKSDRSLGRKVIGYVHCFHGTCLQAHAVVVGGLVTKAGAGRVDQGRGTAQHPLVAHLHVGSEMRLSA
jgi:hypothetical protein